MLQLIRGVLRLGGFAFLVIESCKLLFGTVPLTSADILLIGITALALADFLSAFDIEFEDDDDDDNISTKRVKEAII